MKIGAKLFIVKTRSGEFVSVRNSEAFVKSDVIKAEKNGHKCFVIETTIDAIHSQPE